MRVYFAGPLFTQAERRWNHAIAEGLRAGGLDVFLPQDEVKAIASLDADRIFRIDLDGVRSADVLIAVLDGADPDSGTSFECGIAHALGIPIVVVRTDFRAGGDALPRQTIPTVNLMLSQSAGGVVSLIDPSVDEARVITEILQAVASVDLVARPIERSRPGDPPPP